MPHTGIQRFWITPADDLNMFPTFVWVTFFPGHGGFAIRNCQCATCTVHAI